MSRRTPVEPPRPSRSGPPPLRERLDKPEPKPRRRAGLKEIKRAVKNPTIGTLRRELSHYLVYGLWGFVFIFVVGAFYMYGSAPEQGSDSRGNARYPLIAKAGRAKLERSTFEDQVSRLGMLREEMVTYRFDQLGNLYERWADDQLLLREAKKRRLKIGRKAIDDKLDEQVEQALTARRGDLSERDWLYRLQQQGKTAADEARDVRAELAAGREEIRVDLVREKVREAIENEVKIGDEELAKRYEEVSGHVILVDVGARRPPKLPEGETEDAEETKRRQDAQQAYDEALARRKPEAEQLLTKAKAAPAQFEALARAESDDYTKDQAGKFENVNREAYDMTRFGDAYAEAVFALQPGQISELIQTDNGWAIVKLTGRKTWPDDFKKADPRTFEEAKKLADELYQQLKQGADFAQLAKAKSEDPGSKDNGGVYELTPRGQWVKPFEKMAFALEKDEIGQPVRTSYGYHIIQVLERELPGEGETAEPLDEAKYLESLPEKMREEERAALAAVPVPEHKDLPEAKRVKLRHILLKAEDPDKKIEDLRQQLLSQKQGEHYDEVLKKLREQAYASGWLKAFDPIIKAYLANKDGQQDEATFWLRVAARNWPDSHPEVHWELAKQYDRRSGFSASSESKRVALEALGKIPGEASIQACLKALETYEPDVRKAAIGALGQLQAKSAVARLQDLVRHDPDTTVAEAARAALQQLGADVPERADLSPIPPASKAKPAEQ